jgi:hypothetical protein
MGFTLRSALDALPAQAQLVVAELVPDVVRWNQELLGHLARKSAVGPARSGRGRWTSPSCCGASRPATTRSCSTWTTARMPSHRARKRLALRERRLRTIQAALRPLGVLGVWSSYRDHGFKARLTRSGFEVEEIPCKARGERGAVHTIWMAQLPRARAQRG